MRWSDRQWSLVIFALAFGLRAASLTLYPPAVLPPNVNWETGAIAASLVQTGRFADPYLIPTGLTAHAPPVYVFLLAALYKVLGFTLTAGILHWLLVQAAYAAMYALLPRAGERLGVGRGAGIIGGLAGALFLTWPGEVEGFAGVVLLLLVVAFARRWCASAARTRDSLLLGVAAGAAFHLQPALLPVVLGCLVFELWWRRGPIARRGVALVLAGAVAACLPWAVRNQLAFGDQFFIRGNLGLELYVGNHPGASADLAVSSARGTFAHPRTDLGEARLVRDLGERAYMRRKAREALAWIRAEPAAFARLTAGRIASVWTGPRDDPPLAIAVTALSLFALAGAWRALPRLAPYQRAALLIPLATYPLVYYVTGFEPRYRDPVNGILFLLAGAALWPAPAGLKAPEASGSHATVATDRR